MRKSVFEYFIVSSYLLKGLDGVRKIASSVLIFILIGGFLYFEYSLFGGIQPIQRIIYFAKGYPLNTNLTIYLLVSVYLLVNIIYLFRQVVSEESIQNRKGVNQKEVVVDQKSKSREISKVTFEPSNMLAKEKEVVFAEESSQEEEGEVREYDESTVSVLFGRSLYNDSNKQSKINVKSKFNDPKLSDISFKL